MHAYYYGQHYHCSIVYCFHVCANQHGQWSWFCSIVYCFIVSVAPSTTESMSRLGWSCGVQRQQLRWSTFCGGLLYFILLINAEVLCYSMQHLHGMSTSLLDFWYDQFYQTMHSNIFTLRLDTNMRSIMFLYLDVPKFYIHCLDRKQTQWFL
jgi:hypothetical protein